MVWTLTEDGRSPWRAVNAPHLVALAGDGARFEDGQPVPTPQRTDSRSRRRRHNYRDPQALAIARAIGTGTEGHSSGYAKQIKEPDSDSAAITIGVAAIAATALPNVTRVRI